MNEYKTERPGIYKTDCAVLNKDQKALLAYKKRKQASKAVDELQEQVRELKSDMEEIKQLLKGLAK